MITKTTLAGLFGASMVIFLAAQIPTPLPPPPKTYHQKTYPTPTPVPATPSPANLSGLLFFI